MSSVPTKPTIAVILNPILRYLRPSGAEISIYKFARSRDHLNRENEIFRHPEKLWHQLFWIQHHKIDQKPLRNFGALEMHTKLSGLLEYMPSEARARLVRQIAGKWLHGFMF